MIYVCHDRKGNTTTYSEKVTHLGSTNSGHEMFHSFSNVITERCKGLMCVCVCVCMVLHCSGDGIEHTKDMWHVQTKHLSK